MLLLLVGLIGGLVCGLLGAASGLIVGTTLRAAPVAAWMAVLAALARDGLTDTELRTLGVALLGVLLGLFTSQLARGRRRRSRGAHR